MKICFDCKASIPDASPYCLNCGRIYGDPIARSRKETLPVVSVQKRSTKAITAKRPRLTLLFVIVCALMFMLLGLAISFRSRTTGKIGQSERPQTSKSSAPRSTSSGLGGTGSGINGTADGKGSIEPNSASDTNHVYTGREVSEKPRLISKPEPEYTEEARRNQVAGTVVLKVVFTSRGTVDNIRVVSGLPDGLTERAIEAAKRIQFTPAKKDGIPVSMWMQLEYNFNLY